MDSINLNFPILPIGYCWDPHLKRGEDVDRLTKEIWPSYLISESDIEGQPPSTSLTDEEIDSRFSMWGIRASSTQELVAFASAVLIPVDCTSDRLPDEGWQFAINAYLLNESQTALCLLSANVDPNLRNLGFSSLLLEAAKVIAMKKNVRYLLAPVRPSQKKNFQDISIEEYLNKKTTQGVIFDPWLRTHIRLGGDLLNICGQSVVVKASIAKWQEWLGRTFIDSGDYSIQEGLVPLKIDLERNIGIYTEPNVWIRYKL